MSPAALLMSLLSEECVTLSGIARMILLLLLFLLLVPHGVSVMLKAKCPLNMEEDHDPLNYFRPGDHLIGGVINQGRVHICPPDFSQGPRNHVMR